MPDCVRAFAPGGTCFFSVNLLERNRSLLTGHLAKLRAAFNFVREQKPSVTRAYVILPDYLHCIWTLSAETRIPPRWQAIRAHFARHIRKGEHLPSRHLKKSERGIWQRRFWERMIGDEPDFEQHVVTLNLIR